MKRISRRDVLKGSLAVPVAASFGFPETVNLAPSSLVQSTPQSTSNQSPLRERLLLDVWGYENPIESRTVDTHMRRLREKIGAAAGYLETIRGVGYRFKAAE